jgi:hypothetical protein
MYIYCKRGFNSSPEYYRFYAEAYWDKKEFSDTFDFLNPEGQWEIAIGSLKNEIESVNLIVATPKEVEEEIERVSERSVEFHAAIPV